MCGSLRTGTPVTGDCARATAQKKTSLRFGFFYCTWRPQLVRRFPQSCQEKALEEVTVKQELLPSREFFRLLDDRPCWSGPEQVPGVEWLLTNIFHELDIGVIGSRHACISIGPWTVSKICASVPGCGCANAMWKTTVWFGTDVAGCERALRFVWCSVMLSVVSCHFVLCFGICAPKAVVCFVGCLRCLPLCMCYVNCVRACLFFLVSLVFGLMSL